MMTPMHPDLAKHSMPAAPAAHERDALRAYRKARRAAFLALIEKVFSYTSRYAVEPRRPRVNSPS